MNSAKEELENWLVMHTRGKPSFNPSELVEEAVAAFDDAFMARLGRETRRSIIHNTIEELFNSTDEGTSRLGEVKARLNLVLHRIK